MSMRFSNISWVLTLSFIALLTAVGTAAWLYVEHANVPPDGSLQPSTQSEDNNSTTFAPMHNIKSNILRPDASSTWKTYHNSTYHITFEYPSDWGLPIMDSGNREREGTISCSGPGNGPLSLHDDNSIPLYDNAIIFSSKPEARLTFLSFTTSSTSVALCSEANDFVDLAADRDDLRNLPVDGNNVTVSSYGVKINKSPDYLFVDEGDQNTPWEPVYVHEFYRFYGRNIRVEGFIGYELDTDRLTESDCVIRGSLTREACAAHWLKASRDARDIRSSFANFAQLIDSFTFAP